MLSKPTEGILRHLGLPFVFVIRVYRFFSPVKQWIFGPYARCRFHPTCSEYALECFRILPVHHALAKSFLRICKCNPMHPGGYDPAISDQDGSHKPSSSR